MTDPEESKTPEGFLDRLKTVEGTMLGPARDGIPTARVDSERLLDFMRSMKDGPGLVFEMLTDVCSVDELPADPRFDVIFHLRSLKTGELVRIKAFAKGDPPSVPSVVALYPTADWHEREAYDMMGIRFEGHPDLKRILMPLEYEHYPLRKDFPLEGIDPGRLYRRLYPE